MRKKWTEDDEIYLEYYLYDSEDSTYEPTQEILERSPSKIAEKAYKLRQKNKSVGYLHKPFTDRDIHYIKNMVPRMPLADVAEALGRSKAMIQKKASELGIKKYKKISDYDAEIRKLAEEGCYKSQISRKLGLNVNSLHAYMKRHGIECQPAPKEASGKRFRELNDMYMAETSARKRGYFEQNSPNQ